MQMLQAREASGALSNLEYIRTHPINSNRVAEVQARLQGLQRQPAKSRRFEQFRDYLAYHYPQFFSRGSNSEFALALEHQRNGRYARAEQLLQTLIDSDSDSIWYRYTLAENFRFQKRDREAGEVYQQLLLLYPEDYAIGLRLAEVLVDQARYPEALKILQLLEQIYVNDLAEADYHWFNANRELAKKLYKKLLEHGRLDVGSEARIRERLEKNEKSS
jgi:predicted Zn-dependent protease